MDHRSGIDTWPVWPGSEEASRSEQIWTDEQHRQNQTTATLWQLFIRRRCSLVTDPCGYYRSRLPHAKILLQSVSYPV
jgi:hypothetical protein